MVLDVLISTRRQEKIRCDCQRVFETNHGDDIIDYISLVAQLCLTLCALMNHSTPVPVWHQDPESTQTHAHWVGDAIQPSHFLLSPSPPALNPSQHQGLFQWVSSSHHVAKVFPGLISLGGTGWISLQSKGLSRVFFNTTVHRE